MKSAELFKTTIMSSFPCAIENGDVTGLDDDEAAELEFWLTQIHEEIREEYGKDAGVYFEYGEASEFAVCDILRQRGDCVEVTATVLF